MNVCANRQFVSIIFQEISFLGRVIKIRYVINVSHVTYQINGWTGTETLYPLE